MMTLLFVCRNRYLVVVMMLSCDDDNDRDDDGDSCFLSPMSYVRGMETSTGNKVNWILCLPQEI